MGDVSEDSENIHIYRHLEARRLEHEAPTRNPKERAILWYLTTQLLAQF